MRTAVEMADFCFGWEDLNDPEVRDRLVAKRIEEAKKSREEAVSKGRKPDSIFWGGDSESNLTYDGALSTIKCSRETKRNSWRYVVRLFAPIEGVLGPGIGQTWGPNDEVVYAGLSVGTGLKHHGLMDVQKVNVAVGLTRNRCIIADSTKKGEKGIRIISYDDILGVYYENGRVIVKTTAGGDVGFSIVINNLLSFDLSYIGGIDAETFVQIVECYRKGVQYEAPRPGQKFTQAPQAAPPTEPPQAAPQAAAPAAPPAGVGLSAETVEALKQFKELLDAGILTQEEFDGKKKQLLGL